MSLPKIIALFLFITVSGCAAAEDEDDGTSGGSAISGAPGDALDNRTLLENEARLEDIKRAYPAAKVGEFDEKDLSFPGSETKFLRDLKKRYPTGKFRVFDWDWEKEPSDLEIIQMDKDGSSFLYFFHDLWGYIGSCGMKNKQLTGCVADPGRRR